MTPLHFPLYTSPDLLDCETSTEMAKLLVAPKDARDGDIVAVHREYRATMQGVAREELTNFVVCVDGALEFRTYRALEASQQGPLAHLEMLMQGEPAFRYIVHSQLADMEKTYQIIDWYSVFYLPGVIGVIKAGGYWGEDPWTQGRLDDLIRLVLPTTSSSHAAMTQYAELGQTMQDMRDLFLLHGEEIDLPDFVCPDLSQFRKVDLSGM